MRDLTLEIGMLLYERLLDHFVCQVSDSKVAGRVREGDGVIVRVSTIC